MEDTNADLIGYVYGTPGGDIFQVCETWHVLPAYVVCNHWYADVLLGSVIRPASVVRRRQQLDRVAA